MEKTYTIKKDFMLREVAGQFVVVAIGKATRDFKGIINLNKTGAFLWQKMNKPTTKTSLVKALISEYEVSEKVALHDVSVFLDTLEGASLVE